MRIIAVIGSPHKEGPSASITEEILRGAKDAGHEVKIYRINEMNVRGCQGCKYCKNNRTDCILQDDLLPYWKDLHECGALIVSAPNYCAQICGPMITYMNRHYCLMMNDGPRIRPGIKLIGVFSQGYSDEKAYLDQYRWFLGDFQARKFELKDMIVHTSAIPYDKDSEIMKRAYQVGHDL